ncbi:MAG: DUF3793 family protein [Oscillospiraceae bacterium]
MFFRNSLIEYCSPTLASLKVASLFRYYYDNIFELYQIINEEKDWLSQKGIFIEVITIDEKSALIYIFREKHLQDILNNDDIKPFLKNKGYTSFSVRSCLDTLKKHFETTPCPHEIGIFLGYPLDDVISFIENKGQNCQYCGYWKVYHHKNDALKIFSKFTKCTKIYKKLFSEGTSIQKLTVSI